MDSVVARIGRERIYDVTGIQFLPFNTVYQLVASTSNGELEAAAQLLMIPDLINNHLCGSSTNEVTNASTTQLLDARTHQWSTELCEQLGIRPSVLPRLHQPGARSWRSSQRPLCPVSRSRWASNRRCGESRHSERDRGNPAAAFAICDLHLVRNVGARRVRARGTRHDRRGAPRPT